MAETITRVRTQPEWIIAKYIGSSIPDGESYAPDFEFEIEGLATYRVRFVGDVETPEDSNPPESWVFSVGDRTVFVERIDNQPDPLA